jgi:4-amino-4-deoxy-L-arabinose transferase-like glycosyltransferase
MNVLDMPANPASPLRQVGSTGTDGVRRTWTRRLFWLLGLALVSVLAFANLTTYPTIWFDEGIHLHVPKAVALFGVYADYSSEGFRFYGPTMSVGPTVMLPIAFIFELAGVGLLQARLVIVAYLLCAVLLFWLVGKQLGSRQLSLLALALLGTSRGVDLVYYGRQVLGEVPAFAFLLAGLWCWFGAWARRDSWGHLAAGALFGLAVVTKYQFLIVLVPGLTLAWMVDRFYYRLLPTRTFVWPLVTMAAIFAAWQALAVFYLGPSLASDNLRMMREAAAGAALSVSPQRMGLALIEVIKPSVYSCLLIPAVLYGAARGLERSLASLRWTVIWCLVTANLGWFVVASIGWTRYAFCGFALGALLVARLLCALFDRVRTTDLRGSRASVPARLGAVTVAGLAAVTVLVPLGFNLRDVLRPQPDAAGAMARYLNIHISPASLVETWEPEMGFLTDHRYHYPPPRLLITAVASKSGGRPPADEYDFRSAGLPDYVLEGPFARWVGLYPPSRLDGAYALKTAQGGYTLYERLSPTPAAARSR